MDFKRIFPGTAGVGAPASNTGESPDALGSSRSTGNDSELKARTSKGPMSAFRAKLPGLGGNKETQPQAPMMLASVDLARGIQAEHLNVPEMRVNITIEDAGALKAMKGYDTNKEQVILQSLGLAAHEALNEASTDLKAAVKAIDASMAKIDDPAQLAEQASAFEKVCNTATSAQETKVQNAVQERWKMHQQRDKALTKLNVKFGAKLAIKSAQLASSVASLAGGGVTLPAGLFAIAKTTVGIGLHVKDFAQNRDGARAVVEKMDKVLTQAYTTEGIKGKAIVTARSVAEAAGLPFVDAVGKMDAKIDDFLAKSARVDRQAKSMFQQANKLMEQLDKTDMSQLTPKQQDKVREMKVAVGELLGTAGNLMGAAEQDITFYKDMKERTKAFREQNGVATTAATAVTVGLAVKDAVPTVLKALHTVAGLLH